LDTNVSENRAASIVRVEVRDPSPSRFTTDGRLVSPSLRLGVEHLLGLLTRFYRKWTWI